MRKAHATSEIERYVDRWMDGRDGSEIKEGSNQRRDANLRSLARREEAIGTMTPLCSGRRLPGGRGAGKTSRSPAMPGKKRHHAIM